MKKVLLTIAIISSMSISIQAHDSVKINIDTIAEAKSLGECVQEGIEYAHGDYELYKAYVRGCISGLKK